MGKRKSHDVHQTNYISFLFNLSPGPLLTYKVGGQLPPSPQICPPTRACFAPEKVPFFSKGYYFSIGRHNATQRVTTQRYTI